MKSNLPVNSEGYAYQALLPLVHATLQSGISVLLRGHPGVGKSAMAEELAGAMDLPLHDIRLAQRDPAEIGGVYFPDRETKDLNLMVPAWVKSVCDAPGFVFLDEINAAVTRLHQAAAYQIVLEHRVGPYQFHPDTVVMGAGNLAEDNAIVTQLSSALCNRFAHFTLRVDAESWLAWAGRNQVNNQIMAFISRYRESALYDNDGNYAFPSPRSWSMASRVLQNCAPSDQRRVMASCVGICAAEAFENYLKIYRRVDAAKIIEKGQAQDFSGGKFAEPSFIYAALFSVAAWIKERAQVDGPLSQELLENIVHFLNSPGLDPEYVFLFLKQLKAGSAVTRELKAIAEYRRLATDLVDMRVSLYQ